MTTRSPLQPLTAFGLLRWGYLAPSPDAWRVTRSQEWADALAAAFRDAAVANPEPLVEALRDASATFSDKDEWEGESNRAFGAGAVVSPHETEYTATGPFMQANDLADIRGFYAAFGVEPSLAQAERADHIALELEFLYMLAWQAEKNAPATSTKEVQVDAAKKFLEAHLGRFAGPFADKAETAGIHPFFVALAAATAALVRAAVRQLDVHPAPPSRTGGSNLEPDHMECAGCPAATKPVVSSSTLPVAQARDANPASQD